MKRTLCPPTALPVLFAFALVGCEATKSENPLSPSVAGPIAGVDITAPRLLEPGQGFKVKESQQPLKLVIENSTTTGVRPIVYSFEIATDSEFQTKVYARSGIPNGDSGRTSVTVDRLDLGRAYYWRVRAGDGANSSSYSTASFEVLPKPLLNPPPQLAPINGVTTADRRPELIVGPSERNAAIGAVSYGFQISTNAAFTAIVSAGASNEGGGNTGFTPAANLAAATVHYWRVSASDGETTTSFSGVQTFKTPAAATPAPAPGPGPGQPGLLCIEQRRLHRQLRDGEVPELPCGRRLAGPAGREHGVPAQPRDRVRHLRRSRPGVEPQTRSRATQHRRTRLAP